MAKNINWSHIKDIIITVLVVGIAAFVAGGYAEHARAESARKDVQSTVSSLKAAVEASQKAMGAKVEAAAPLK